MPRFWSLAMAASGSGSTPRMRPRRSGVLPSLETTIGADCLALFTAGDSVCAKKLLKGGTPRVAETASPECCRKLRRLGLFMGFVETESAELFLSDVDVFPAHFNAAAGMNLQADDAVGKFLGGIG